ncbi:MAG: YigZ family protein [Clostridia bacterium]|nr:YigZ family protein [Clostridia bacterium]
MALSDTQVKKYTTLEREASAELIEKKSLFIGYASPVKSDEEALAFIKRIKEKHSDATHNVYAYYLRSGAMARYSDDNEPQGTAGPPVLEVIKKSGCDDCVVVVTRYFGGVLLGAGGLVRAYGAAAGLALEAAHIVTYEEFSVYTLECDYGEYNKLAFELESVGAIVDSCDFTDKVKLQFAVKKDKSGLIVKRIMELSGGRLAPEYKGDRFDKDKKR